MLLLSGVCIGMFLSFGISVWRDKTETVQMEGDTQLNAETERKRFAEEPVSIPWYQEESEREGAFLVSDVGESGETKAICRINEESRNVVELRRWTLCKDARTGEESLCIRDCLEQQDTFSGLPVSGKDASAYASGYREIYEYTDDGCLSSFEARGMMMWEHEPVEVSLLSVDYIRRNDGTLCHKQYHRWPMTFGTTGQTQSGDYDEQGRLVFWYGYITHGAMEKYYIYEGSSMEPEYCLSLDWGGAYVEMTAFDKDT